MISRELLLFFNTHFFEDLSFFIAFSNAALYFLSKLVTRPLMSPFTLGEKVFFIGSIWEPSFLVPNQFTFGHNPPNGSKCGMHPKTVPILRGFLTQAL